MSSCADEAALLAALAYAEHGVGADDVIILGSPFHYTVLIHYGQELFWLNGKREFFTAGAWAEQARQHADAQAAFDERVAPFDRIIAPSGCHLFATNESTIPHARLERMWDCLRMFFGVDLQQIAATRGRGITFKDNAQLFDPLMNLAAARDAADAERMIRDTAQRHPGSEYELALYAYRSLRVRQPVAYLHAALRGRRARELAAQVQTIADAVRWVQQVPGNDSVLHSTERIALPGEVLLFGTGNHRDKALLLYMLIQLAPAIPSVTKTNARVVLGRTESCVRLDGQLISTVSFQWVGDVPDVMMELGGES